MADNSKQLLLHGIDKEASRKFAKKTLVALLLGVSCSLVLTFAPRFVVVHVDSAAQLNAKADTHSSVEPAKYYWPSARGHPGSYTSSPYVAHFPVSKPTWTWEYQCCSGCTWCTIMQGVLIDDKKDIYLTAEDGIRKFTPGGTLLWSSHRRGSEQLHQGTVLHDGAVLGITTTGRAFAVSMQTGKQVWSTSVAGNSTPTNGAIDAHEGVLIVPAGLAGPKKSPSTQAYVAIVEAVGLNTTDGNILWRYEPDWPMWNFFPAFAGDGTVVFQSYDGTVQRNSVSTGALIWKSGGLPGSWTDGTHNIGSNGIVYSTALSDDKYFNIFPKLEGYLFARRLSDGHLLWRRTIPYHQPPNSVPAVGTLSGVKSQFSVVIGVGWQCMAGPPIDVVAFDAETGEQQWYFQGPMQVTPNGSPSDDNPIAAAQRDFNNVSIMTAPNPWGTITIDGSGAVFVGGITGHFFRLKDSNGDGKVYGHGEVAKLTTDASWVGSMSMAIAPGLSATGNDHTLFVWTY